MWVKLENIRNERYEYSTDVQTSIEDRVTYSYAHSHSHLEVAELKPAGGQMVRVRVTVGARSGRERPVAGSDAQLVRTRREELEVANFDQTRLHRVAQLDYEPAPRPQPQLIPVQITRVTTNEYT